LLVCASVFVLASPLLALAQGAPPAPPQGEPGILESVGKWLDEQAAGAKDAAKAFGREAGSLANSTAEKAKDAAGDLAKTLPQTGVVTGHEVCQTAPNGAPDCEAAANAICKAKGFKSGKSVDMTTAESCPAKVYMAGRASGPECKNETFVSSALCQ
jgi:hypothetical protein